MNSNRPKDESRPAQPSTPKETTVQEHVQAEAIFPTGSRVKHSTYGLGKVIACEASYVTVRFEDNPDKAMVFDAQTCIEKAFLEIVTIKNAASVPQSSPDIHEKVNKPEIDCLNTDFPQEDRGVSHPLPDTAPPCTVSAESSVPSVPVCVICKNAATKYASLTKDGRTIHAAICSDCVKRLRGISYVNIDKLEDLDKKNIESDLQPNYDETENDSPVPEESKMDAVKRPKRIVWIVILIIALLILAVGIMVWRVYFPE